MLVDLSSQFDIGGVFRRMHVLYFFPAFDALDGILLSCAFVLSQVDGAEVSGANAFDLPLRRKHFIGNTFLCCLLAFL